MNTKNLNYIWAKDLRKKETESKIVLLTPQEERLGNEYAFMRVVSIGSTIPKEDLGNEKDGYLEVGDDIIVDTNLAGVKYSWIPLDGTNYCLMKPHNIIGYEKGKK